MTYKKIIGKDKLFYIIYDLKDNIIAYFDNIYELLSYTGLRLKDINYKFKKCNEDYLFLDIYKSRYKLYRFDEVEE